MNRVADYGKQEFSFLKPFSNATTIIPLYGGIYNSDDGTWNGAYTVYELTTSTITILTRGARNGGRYLSYYCVGE